MLLCTAEYIGMILNLCLEKRGTEHSIKDVGHDRTMFQFLLPLNEIIVDLHDTLKRVTSGYGTFDYEDYGYELTDIVKVIRIIILVFNNYALKFE